MGRRSLLVHWPDASDARLILTSVSPLPRLGDPSPPNTSCNAHALQEPSLSPSCASPPPHSAGDAVTDPQQSVSSLPWQELTPGIYHLTFAAVATLAGATDGAPTPHDAGSKLHSAQSQTRCPAEAASFRATGNSGLTGTPSAVSDTVWGACAAAVEAAGVADTGDADGGEVVCPGQVQQQLQRQVAKHLGGAVLRSHSWTDAQLNELVRYSRPADLLAPPTPKPAASQQRKAKKAPAPQTAKPASPPGQHQQQSSQLNTAQEQPSPPSPTEASAARHQNPDLSTSQPTPHTSDRPAVEAASPSLHLTERAAPGPLSGPSNPSHGTPASSLPPTSSTPSPHHSSPRLATAQHQPVAALLPAAPVLLLFSGGVDSMLLAALMHRCLPPHVPIDLANICFDGGRSPDRLQGLAGLEELSRMAGHTRSWRLIAVDSSLREVDAHKARILRLLEPSTTVMDLNIGAALWLAASAQGNLTLPACHQHRFTSPSLPLTSATPGCHPASQVTDSSAACHRTGAEGLRQAPTDRQPPATPQPACADSARASASDRHPSSRGVQGAVPTALSGSFRQGQQYRSCARVVLLGHGADEQCAGYGRHRTKFNASGMAGLQAELALDVQRMWLRNLGRDDRLVADQSREARHPFLDEDVMSMLLSFPLGVVADLTLPAGTGDKQVLRHALTLLGLPEAAGRPKRAIQFGSRIGKLSNCRDFGSNTAANARNAGSVQLTDIPKLQ
ncbi:MAG: hypothetical protein WDW36_005766 [Sanguina aurantia]